MLIEIVVAVGVLSLVLIGVSDLMTRSQRVGTFQRQKDEANTIARSLLNEYRIQRDNDPDTFEDNVVGLSRDVCVSGKDYSCTVEVNKLSGAVEVIATVSWVDGVNTLSITLNQKLTDVP